MKSVKSTLVKVSTKAPTGITGLDEISGGGLPHGRTTLLVGGPGSGNTVLALLAVEPERMAELHWRRACA